MHWEFEVDWIAFPADGAKGVARIAGLPYSLKELLSLRGGEGWELASLATAPNTEVMVAVFKRSVVQKPA